MTIALARQAGDDFAGAAPAVAGRASGVVAPAASLLHFITCGSVDDGKSTLIGRLLYESNAVFDDQLEALRRDSKKFGTTGEDLDFALLVDGLSAEREQGITIDVAYRYFSTAKRAFIIADTPGHEQYTRNMATGASQAELAVILVDARKGLLPQTRRHSFITSMLGIRSAVVAVNKMDLVGFSQAVFDKIVADYREILPNLGFTDVSFIPLSAKNGDNVTTRSPAMPWYGGETLLERLENAAPQTALSEAAPFRMPVQWVNRPNLDFRGYCGTVASGRIAAGDAVVVLPARRSTRVKAVFGPNGEMRSAEAGEAVTLTLDDEVDISRGDVIIAAADAIAPRSVVEADILWMVDRPLVAGGRFIAKLASAQTPANLRSLDHAIDIHTYQPREANALLMNEIGHVRLAFDRPLVATAYAENPVLGAFILIDQLTNETVALGLVREPATDSARPHAVAAVPASALDRARRLWIGKDARENPERLQGVVRFRALGALVVALLAMLFGLPLIWAVVLAILDFAVRPLLRSFVDQTEKLRVEAADPTIVRDGAGI